MSESHVTTVDAIVPPEVRRAQTPAHDRPTATAEPPAERRRPASTAVPRTWYTAWGKRALDLTIAGAALIVLSPILAAVALLTRLSLGRGIFYRQSRVGYSGEDFEMIKFRTMRTDRRARELPFHGRDRRIAHKRDDDPRHTPLGRVLRRYSIDELPQLLNVMRGEMSIVGPRPELSSVVDRRAARHHARHTVQPGITGLWQVTQRQEGRPLAEDFDDDLAYLPEISLRTDLRIIQRTFGVVLAGSGR
jgi:lipopolysaccharide/colanic/teichoic acid biosynthesis glycosyltransferase